MASPPVVIVLAAGAGSRFRAGSHKLAAPLRSGQPVLAATLTRAIATGLEVVVVTTEALADLARSSIAARDVLVVPDAGEDSGFGMGHSIAAGVGARAHAGGWLILPGDLPLVRPDSLMRVALAVAAGYGVVLPTHRRQQGHPVGFGPQCRDALLRLGGAQGAAPIAREQKAAGRALEMELDDPGIVADIDTLADLARAERLLAGR